MKTALITGASSGIGLEFAKLLASKGIDLVLVARSSDKLNKIRTDLEQQFRIKVKIIIQDLALKDAPQKIYDEILSANMNIDFLINNAGIGELGNFTETDWKKEEQMINLNVMALVHLTKLFLKEMVKRRSGKILNISSTAAFQPGPGMSVYFASKSFVLHFSEAINYEVKKTGVTVTALCPGPTDSDFKEDANMQDSRLFKNKKVATATEVAEFGYREMMKGKSVAVHGIKNYLLAISNRFAPRNMVTAIAAKFQEKI